MLLDYGSNYGPGTATHHLTLYRPPSGALVFGAGTVQWSWGLDGKHDRGGSTADAATCSRRRSTCSPTWACSPTRCRPASSPATASTDTAAPTSHDRLAGDGANVDARPARRRSAAPRPTPAAAWSAGSRSRSTAAAPGTRRRAAGTGPTPGRPSATGSATIRAARGRRQRQPRDARPGDHRHRRPGHLPVQRSGATRRRAAARDGDTDAVELGVKFRSERGRLHHRASASTRAPATPAPTSATCGPPRGALLGQATFTGETASRLAGGRVRHRPVAIDANTTYVASYHAPERPLRRHRRLLRRPGRRQPAAARARRRRRRRQRRLRVRPRRGLPDRAPSTRATTGSTSSSTTTSGPTRRRPTVSARLAGQRRRPASPAAPTSPRPSASRWTRRRSRRDRRAARRRERRSSRRRSPTTPADAHGDARPERALQHSTTYTATVKGGAGGVTDAAGNALAADSSWSFTTAAPPPPPPDEGPGRADPRRSPARRTRSAATTPRSCAPRASTSSRSPTSRPSTPRSLAGYDVVILGETAAHRRAGDDAQRLGAGGRQPDRDAARRAARRAARPDRPPAPRSRTPTCWSTPASGPGAGIVGQTIQFHGAADRYALNGAHGARDAVLERDDGDGEPGRHAAQRRRATAARRRPSPTTSRARSSTRARAIRPGPARSATAIAARSAPTTCSSATPPAIRSPTGSTSTRSRSRRPTSSSACSPT